MNQQPTVSVIIPAFNEETFLGRLLEMMREQGCFEKWEILVVDDGSTDRTTDIATGFPIKLIRHESNKGYGAALKTGIRKAQGKLVLMLDSDGQHDPKHLEQMVAMLDSFDMVIGERSTGSYQVKNRKHGKWIIRKTGEFLVEQKLPDFNSGLRGFHRNLIASMLHIMPNGFSFSTTSTLAYLKEGYTIGTFPIVTEERQGRKSTVRFFKDGPKTMLLLFRIIMLFNPIKVFFPAAFLSTLAGAAWGIFGYLEFGRFSISGTVLITFGMLLFFFGLIADQIALLNRKKTM
jgi:glycosyltransferase involved in cell wall biosynthesis